jgi:hypothetical protein
MRTIALALAMAVATAALATTAPAAADGQRRTWRAPAYAGAISRNVITPWYVGYYPSRYSYYRPTPMPRGTYAYPRVYRDGCWVAIDGNIFWDCW